MIEITNRHDERWVKRFDELRTYYSATGQLPPSAGKHSALANWLRNQRSALARGAYPADRLTALQTIPGTVDSKESRLDQLASYVAETGQLPRIGGPTDDPREAELAKYLVHSLRPTIRRGTIKPRTLSQAQLIPGVAKVRLVPNQDDTLGELRAFVTAHGHFPSVSHEATRQESRLAVWARNNTTGVAASKSPALRERHEALSLILSEAPRKSYLSYLGRLAALEKFTAEQGYLPSQRKDSDADERSLSVWLRRANEIDMDAVSARRFSRAMAYPSWSDFLWLSRHKAVAGYVKVRLTLPTLDVNRSMYFWAAGQRAAYRNGILPGWKVEKLMEIPRLLPVETRAAAVAA